MHWGHICMYGQESPGGISLFKFLTKTYFFQISTHLNFFGKIDWSMNSGWQRAGDTKDILNIHFNFQDSTKKGCKVGTIYKTEPFPAF